jgi:hypothetical protein
VASAEDRGIRESGRTSLVVLASTCLSKGVLCVIGLVAVLCAWPRCRLVCMFRGRHRCICESRLRCRIGVMLGSRDRS